MSYQSFPQSNIVDGYTVVYKSIDGYFKPILITKESFSSLLIKNTQAKSPAMPDKLPSCIHRWLCNDADGYTFIVDDGSMANATFSVHAPITQGDTGLYSKSISFGGNSWANSNNDVGIPVSNTILTMHGWIYPRTFTTHSYGRLLTKIYNPTGISPYTSCEVLFNANTAGLAVQWATAGTLKGAGPTAGNGLMIANQWSYVAVTFSQAAGNMTVNFYINGNLVLTSVVASGVIDWNAGLSGPWAMGANYAGAIGNATLEAWQFDWRVEDGVVLTQAQILANYQTGMGLIY